MSTQARDQLKPRVRKAPKNLSAGGPGCATIRAQDGAPTIEDFDFLLTQLGRLAKKVEDMKAQASRTRLTTE